MAKPAAGLPTWASDTNYPAGAEPEAGTATKVAPTTGQDTIGWRPDQIPTAQEENYWKNLVYQWIQYLDGGALTGDVEIDGNLHVTGTTTLDDNLTVSGDVQGEDLLFTTGKSMWIHASAGQVANGSNVTPGNSWMLYNTGTGWTMQYADTSEGALLFPVPLCEGDTLTEWNVRVTKGVSGASITAALYKQSAWGALVLVGSTHTSTATSSNVTLGDTGLTELFGQDKYVIMVTTTTINNDVVFGADITFKRV